MWIKLILMLRLMRDLCPLLSDVGQVNFDVESRSMRNLCPLPSALGQVHALPVRAAESAEVPARPPVRLLGPGPQHMQARCLRPRHETGRVSPQQSGSNCVFNLFQIAR